MMGQGDASVLVIEKPARVRTRKTPPKTKGVKTCPMCSNKTPLRPRQKYCSDACKAKAFRERSK